MQFEPDAGAPHVAVTLPGGMLVEFNTADFVQQWDSGWADSSGGGRVLLGFWVESREDVDKTYNDLVGAGYIGHQRPYDAFWGGRYAIVDDPDGTGIGLMTPADQNRSYWPPTSPPRGP